MKEIQNPNNELRPHLWVTRPEIEKSKTQRLCRSMSSIIMWSFTTVSQVIREKLQKRDIADPFYKVIGHELIDDHIPPWECSIGVGLVWARYFERDLGYGRLPCIWNHQVHNLKRNISIGDGNSDGSFEIIGIFNFHWILTFMERNEWMNTRCRHCKDVNSAISEEIIGKPNKQKARSLNLTIACSAVSKTVIS